MIYQHPKIRKHLKMIKSYPMSDISDEKNIINLSSNENATEPSSAVLDVLQSALLKINRYSDTTCKHVINKLSNLYDIPSENLICGNGSAELIFLLAELFSTIGDEVIILKHGFLFYETAIARTGASLIYPDSKDFIDSDALLNAVTERTKLVFIDNPNNPTGAYISGTELRKIRQNLREDILLVIDAAYAEYVLAPDYDDGMQLVNEFDNVCMLRTFSKIYGLAGLRLGWIYGPRQIIDNIRKLQQPASVSTAAQYAALAALDEKSRLLKLRKQNQLLRTQFIKKLSVFNIKIYPSEANFVLVDFYSPSIAVKIFDVLKQNGILVRPMNLNRLHSCLRVTIGKADEMAKLMKVLCLAMEHGVTSKAPLQKYF